MKPLVKSKLIMGLAAMALLANTFAAPAKSSNEPSPSFSVRSWKSGTHTITVDGRERTFLLDLPKKLRPGAALVMVFHGYSDSAENARKRLGFTRLVAQHGFVAVYPQGTPDDSGNNFFNVGYAFHKDMKVNDVKFARDLAARLVHDLGLDPRSVFATGASNGGDMCYFLACQPQPFVFAIAPVAGTMMAVWTNEFSPHARTSVMAVNGTRDQTTLWAGDILNREGWGAYLGIEGVMDFWVKNLSLEKTETVEPAKVLSKTDLRVHLHRWWTRVDKTEVRLYKIQGGVHDWPGHLSDPHTSTAAEIWRFFQNHRPRSNKE